MRLLSLAAGLALLGLTSPPSLAQFELPGTQPGALEDWPLLPDEYCANCHGDYTPEHHEPWDSWAGSMMANAARDPLFWAAVDIANQDVPGSGEFCIRCHSPRAWLEGRSSTPDGSALIGELGQPGGDFAGIDCQFCHRMYEGPENSPFIGNAQFWVDPGTPTQEPPYRGPYTDADRAAHPWQYSAYHQTSEFCGVCHNLTNPAVNLRDETGADTGLEFPEQVTYTEWNQSAFPARGIECQTCHMPATTGLACAFGFERDHVPQHQLAGANAWIPEVLRGEFGGSLGRIEEFDRAINLAIDQLQNHSATLTLQSPSRAMPGDTVDVRVKITNLTGHKLPTGYPEGRRMWLHVRVVDVMNQVVYESGAYDLATATLAADTDAKIYEAKHGQHADGTPGFHLVLNDRIFLDNRIPPEGFRPDATTEPIGYTYPTLPDGALAHWDWTTYSIAVPGDADGPLRITTSLYYQTASREYIEFLRDENTSGPDPHRPAETLSRGEHMYELWETYDRCPPILMKTATRRLVLDAPPLESAAAPEPPVVRLLGARQNPFRGQTQIAWQMPAEGFVRLSVFDVRGRSVRELHAGPRGVGEHDVTWDGRDGSGRQAAAGTYFVRLEVEGHAARVNRVVLLR